VADRARLTIRDTFAIELIIVGAGRASYNRLAFFTVAALRTRNQLEIGGSFKAVVARWAVDTVIGLLGTLMSAELACAALGLDARRAPAALRTTVLPNIAVNTLLRAEEAIGAHRASRFTPATISLVGADFDIALVRLQFVPRRNRGAVFGA